MTQITPLDKRLNDSFIELRISEEQQKSIMACLNMVRNKDEPTYEHSVRVGLTGKEIAEFTHIVEPKTLYYPGLLHDVGKALTSHESLVKIKGFTEKDRKELSKHPIDGYRILKGIHGFSARIALMHHKFQGERSYPKTLPKLELNISNQTQAVITYCARLISLIDFYDAASYRKNDRFSPGNPRLPTDEEVKADLINSNSDQEYLIKSLYEAGIFGKKSKF